MKSSSIDVVTDIDKKEFQKKYFNTQKPVVIRSLADKHPAGKKWSIPYIKAVCGDVEVDMFDNGNKNSASAFTTPDLKMRFGDYLDGLVANEPSSLRMFLFNMFRKRPQLRKDLPCPDIFRGILGRVGFMFFGSQGITVRIHQDMDMSNVILTQFYGRKKVVLVPPKYSDLLYKLPYNTHSLVDLDKPDYEKYPGLRYIETYSCILEPGDSVYMPSGYWHFITYLDGGFSVSYRKLARGWGMKLKGFLNLCVYMPFDKVMNRIFGAKWLLKKERMAEKKANKALEKLKEDVGSQVHVRLQHQ